MDALSRDCWMRALSRGGWMDALCKLRVVGLMH